MPLSVTSSRKYSTWMRLPNSRPCMSVKAVTTVSIVPASASDRSWASDSIPTAAPGPPGRAACLSRSIVMSARRDLVLLERPHRPLVAVLRRDQVPDAEDQRQDDRERRVVHVGGNEAVVPREARGRERQIEAVHDQDHEGDRQPVHDLVAGAEVPRARL